MPFAIKHNKRIKFKGVWKHYDSRHFISPPHHHHHLGEALYSTIQERKIKIEEEEGVEEEEEMRKKKKKDEERGDKGRGKLTIEVRKEDLEGGGVATCAEAFDCFHH